MRSQWSFLLTRGVGLLISTFTNNNNNNNKEDADGCLRVALVAAAVGVEHDEEDDKQAREIHDTLLR